MARNSRALDSYALRTRRKRLRRGNGHGRAAAGRAGFPFWLKGLIVFGALGLIVFGIAAVAAMSVYNSYAEELLAPDEFAINQPSYGAKIYDRHGELLYEYVDDKAGLRRPVKLADVSPAFLAATIATEDDSFFTNPGINIRGLARAAWENSPFSGTELFGGSGGSSITQQLVKNVYIAEEERMERWSNEGINRKIREMIYALELTQRYSKERILEWYVNQISYGGVYNGVEAASQGYFGKPASELTLAEASLLAGIPQSPAAYDPVNQPTASAQRRNDVLDIMMRQGVIKIGEDRYFQMTLEQLEEARTAEISIQERQFQIEAPHWVLSYIEPQLRALLDCPSVQQLRQEVREGKRDPLADRPGIGCSRLFTDGLVVTTTLDLQLQYRTAEIMERWIREFENTSGSRNGAMMISDPKTGEILVMLGSRDYFRDDIDGRNNNATGCNSPGSSFKPFVYLTTFKELGWGPGTVQLDTPITYTDALGNTFSPRNPIPNFSGPVTVRYSLGNSLNVTPVKAAEVVGPQKIVVEARRLGFVDSFRRDGCSSGGYGPAIATGGVDVTLDEMMYAYTVLANGGVMRGQEPIRAHDSDERQMDPVSLLTIQNTRGEMIWDIGAKRREARVVEAAYTYMLWDIMTDPQAQCATFQCGGITIPGYKAGVKTGTSEPYDPKGPNAGRIGETWAFGYSPDLVVGIWAGNSDNAPISNLLSTSISFRAMRDTFIMAHQGRGVTPMVRPPEVVEAELCVPSGLKATELCGRKTKDIFYKDKLPTEEDTWWQRVRIDNRNGKLAAPNTPPVFVEEKVMLVLPQSMLSTEEDRKRWTEWAAALGIALAPTEVSDGAGEVPGLPGTPGQPGTPGGTGESNEFIAIFSPTAGTTVRGRVDIIARALAPAFRGYRLEVGAGVSPAAWTELASSTRPVSNGVIATWETTNLPPGIYTLRLVVDDERLPDMVTTATILVNNQGESVSGGGTTPPPITP